MLIVGIMLLQGDMIAEVVSNCGGVFCQEKKNFDNSHQRRMELRHIYLSRGD